ncbi:CZB domain-containing protein [Deferribacter abyssi]|uniref:CZB domain-containing protein n=1 Tax=Deferribacter abyssi TaxID=213806 RepID=UPI003C2CCBDD
MTDSYSKFKFSSKGASFIRAKLDHIQFVINVIKCVANRNCSFTIVDHKSCNFGKFYYNEGMKLFKDDPDYKKIENNHIQVHDLGRIIMDSIKNKNFDEAHSNLQKFLIIVSELINELNTLIEKYR